MDSSCGIKCGGYVLERKYKNMELRDTVKMMNSTDYKDRFIAEYMQAKIRYEKLHKMVVKYEAKTLNFTPSCSIDLLKEQKKHMGNYLYCLEVRAEIEDISLDEAEVKILHSVQNDRKRCEENNEDTGNIAEE